MRRRYAWTIRKSEMGICGFYKKMYSRAAGCQAGQAARQTCRHVTEAAGTDACPPSLVHQAMCNITV